MKKYAVIFVHGLAKKPPPSKLEEIWRWGLGRSPTPPPFVGSNPGIDLDTEGVPAFFNYYADVFYGDDFEKDFDSYYEAERDAVLKVQNLDEVAGKLDRPLTLSVEEARFLEEVELKMVETSSPAEPLGLDAMPAARGPSELEIASWLPKPAVQALIKKFALEAYYYLFDKDYVRPSDGVTFTVRQELRTRLINQVKDASKLAQNIVLVSHSMGTMLAYDVVRNCDECPPVDALFTIGSPLGISEVQEQLLAKGKKRIDFPPKLRRWINVYDPLDPICGVDPTMHDYEPYGERKVEDVRESNWGNWRHTSTHYLAGKKFRALLAEVLELKR